MEPVEVSEGASVTDVVGAVVLVPESVTSDRFGRSVTVMDPAVVAGAVVCVLVLVFVLAAVVCVSVAAWVCVAVSVFVVPCA
jgi:hypothetical protein